MKRFIIFSTILLSLSFNAGGQTTAFTFQGSLTNSGLPANGNFDFEFLLFDSTSNGSQLGSTLTRNGVGVSNGAFSVALDYGNQFPGSNRFLEIHVRAAGGGGFTTLSPRQPINSSPYSIKSNSAENAANATTAANALQLGGVAANQFVVTGDTRLSDARNPLPGSANYVQNQNAGPQLSSNFNISGTGTGGTLNATNQYNIGGQHLMSVSGLTGGELTSTFVGIGQSPGTVATNNAFFGFRAGHDNSQGNANSFFGAKSGETTTNGGNSFFGAFSGTNNASGSQNTVLGFSTRFGASNLINSTAVGANAQVDASNTLILGSVSGVNGAASNVNVGIGTTAPSTRLHLKDNAPAGFAILMENANTTKRLYIGNYGSVGAGNHWAGLDSANTSFLYAENSLVFTTPGGIHFSGSTTTEHLGILPNGNVGIGISNPAYKLQVNSTIPNNFATHIQTTGLATGTSYGLVISAGTDVTDSALQIRDQAGNPIMRVRGNGNVGIGTTDPLARLAVAGTMTVTGNSLFNSQLEVNTLLVDNHAGGGTTQTCWNGPTIATCSSSLRYKTNVEKFVQGLRLIEALSPITFNWKSNGMRDLGLAAEQVEKIDPLLVTYNNEGQVDGVKYDRIGVVLINAVKEQQIEIESLKEQVKSQGEAIAAMKAMLCRRNTHSSICKQ